jgi:tripartite-type tricarboxylate transporter receptor subunit TctC
LLAVQISHSIGYARSAPGIGSPPHVAGELFKKTGVDMQHVPYRGGAPAVSDLIGGQVQIMFAAMRSPSIDT